MIDPYETQAVINLKKTRSLIDRILKMIGEKNYCMDIGQQVNAGIGLLKKTNNYILESHLMTCGAKKFNAGKAAKKDFVKEIVRICNITNR